MDSLPQYYRENFFSSDTLYSTVPSSSQFGVAGDPIPYTLRGDNFISGILLVSFVVLVVSLAHSRRFIIKQLKGFFYSHTDSPITETTDEVRFQIFLMGLSGLLMSVTVYQYATYYVADTYIIDSEILLIAIFATCFLIYALMKTVLYTIVNSVFFTPKLNQRWLKLFIFLYALEGIAIFPGAMLAVYFSISLKNIVYYFCFILFFFKILTFYKCWSIFFRQKGGFLQTFLYFCALEIVPLLILTSGMLLLIDNLKLNF